MKLTPAVALILCTAFVSFNAYAENEGSEAGTAVEQFIRQQAKTIGGEEAGQRKLSEPFDFDGLRGTDIAVVYWIGKDNDTTAYLAVFENEDEAWSLTHHLRLGGRGLRHIENVSFSKRLVSIECLEFAGQEPLSSPSLRVTIAVKVKKGLLAIKRTQHEE